MMRLLWGLAAGLLATAAQAEVPRCSVPSAIRAPRAESATNSERARLLPVDSYTLSLVWLPEQCRRRTPGLDGIKCKAASSGGFVLHGLWPDGAGKDWPQYCSPSGVLRASVIRAHYCATPSAQLLQHEWAKHGTCMPGANPDYYFAQSNRLFAALRIPDLDGLSRGEPTARGVAQAFAAANRGMRADMIQVHLKEDWLEEIWLCLDKGLKPQRCPAVHGGPATDQPIRIWRSRR